MEADRDVMVTGRLVDGFTGQTLTEEESRLARDRVRFIELVADGTPENMAGHEIGWSYRRVRTELSNPEFFDAVQAAIDRASDSVEEALFRQARRGNVTAIQMWLYNRRPQRWRDVKHIEVTTESTMEIAVVMGVKTAAIELLRERGVGAAREIGDAVRAIEATSQDADEVA